jgi:hypothetical protein
MQAAFHSTGYTKIQNGGLVNMYVAGLGNARGNVDDSTGALTM